jgi:hypothetical protein
MGFSQATITGVNPPLYTGFQVFLSWTTTSPAGTWFQIYLNDALSWWGQTTQATLILGSVGPIRVDIGTVLPGEEQTSFASSLPAAPARRAELEWLGGTFEGADIAGFQVWSSAMGPVGFGDGGFGDGPFGGITFTALEATITAYPSGIYTDGFGLGGFGLGGFGESASTYTWTSDPLTNGTWYYAVVPFDSAGNLGAPAATSVVIDAPPLPPALFGDNTRLHYTYSSITDEVTLFWNASPG